MKGKRETHIPKNISSSYEILPNVTPKDFLVFVPTVVIDIPVLVSDISIYMKAPIVSITVIVPLLLVYFRPVRENIPFWQHGKELLQFAFRQRRYEFEKETEEYVYVPDFESSEQTNERTENKRTKTTIRARSHSHQTF